MNEKEYWFRQSQSFDASADYYDRFRPQYPEQLVTDIIQKTKVNGTSRILEVGAGSGKATELFANRGLNIDCIEPGVNLAKAGTKKLGHTGRVRYIISRFEEWNGASRLYDLIFSAQAFHWVPKPLGYEKCHHALKPKGYIALFWNFYISGGRQYDDELQSLFKQYPVGYLDTREGLEKRIQRNLDEIRASGYFKEVQVLRYPWSEERTAQEYIGFLKTGNGYLTLDEHKRKTVESKIAAIIQRNGGSITRFYECTLFIAQGI